VGQSVAELTTELAEYKAARTAILSGAQSYAINGRSLTRASLPFIAGEIKEIEGRIFSLQSGRKISPVFSPSRG
jgi:hypothetical protein